MSELSSRGSLIESRLERHGIRLPEPPQPAARYSSCRRDGDQLYVSGQVPFVDGELLAQGLVGADVDLDAAQHLARISALNALAIADRAVGLERLHVVNVVVYVASAADFFAQHLVADGASRVLRDVLGSEGEHARTSVAVPRLPLNSPVEVQCLFGVSGGSC